MKYTALSGRFYEFGGIYTNPLDEDTAYAINSILALDDGKLIICFNDKAVRHFWA
jgi:hypothetical protein